MSHRLDIAIQPQIAFIAIQNADFETDARWRGLVDLLARHGPYNVLTVTMRCKGHPITEPDTHALFARLVAHAHRCGLGMGEGAAEIERAHVGATAAQRCDERGGREHSAAQHFGEHALERAVAAVDDEKLDTGCSQLA